MFGTKLTRTLLFLLAVLILSATGVRGSDILLVTASVDPEDPGDALIKTFLEGLGHTVTYIDDDEDEPTTEAAAAAVDLVFISESVSSGRIREEITEIATPMIVTEAWGWDEMGLITGGGEDAPDVATTNIDIVAPGHPLAAGFTGTVSVLTDITSEHGPARFGGHGYAGAAATVIATATLSDGQTWDVIFVYEKGAALAVAPADGSPQIAADIRVCLGFDEQSYFIWNENAHELLAAAVNYALGITEQARNPKPPSASENVAPSQLSWSAGENANTHNVYLGTSPTLGAADLKSEGQTETTYQITETLTPNIIYYWRVDEVEANGTTVHTGLVWSFTTSVLFASNPNPADGAIYVDPSVSLTWIPGYSAETHDVYLGTDKAAVTNATTSSPEFKQNQPDATYTPASLEKGTTYYWRIDEIEADGTTKHNGDTWRFTTLPDIPISDPNLIGWWKLDYEGIDIVTDYSGHDNHGTPVGNLRWVPGFNGDALKFDGASYVELPTGMIGTDKGSVTVWIKTTLADRGMIFYGAEGSSGDGFGGQNEFHINMRTGGLVRFFLEGGDDADMDIRTAAVNDDTWHHITLTWDIAGDVSIYVDGNEPVSDPHNGYNFVFSGAIRLGSPIDAQRYFIGLMDDVRLYDYPLSLEDIPETMVAITQLASNPKPGNRAAISFEPTVTLSWSPGENAAEHDVYFSDDQGAVATADTSTTDIYRGRQDSNSYTPPETLEWGRTYYWRIDEVGADATISKGQVWSFTAGDFLVVDDFESYNDIEAGEEGSNLVYLTWIDGYVEPPAVPTNGSTMGYVVAFQPTMEFEIVHDGYQSAPFYYDNSTVSYSEITANTNDLSIGQDWTRYDVKVLTLWFYGDPNNAVTEQLYVKLNDVKVVYDGDAANLATSEWTQWNIDLSVFGIDLTNVTQLGIGLDKIGATGGSGVLLLDDIRLYR